MEKSLFFRYVPGLLVLMAREKIVHMFSGKMDRSRLGPPALGL